jgi:histidinol dehydrogenase
MLEIFTTYDSYKSRRGLVAGEDRELSTRVADIIAAVRKEGDKAVLDFTNRFDRTELKSIPVNAKAMENAFDEIPDKIKKILSDSIEDVRNYHENQKPESWLHKKPDGSVMGMQYNAIDAVGCYVPGGQAGYPSTVIMTVVPAQIAGVKRIVIVSPPGQNGRINPLVLACSVLLGVSEVYAVGGAQAVAALAYGTSTIARVNKIVGPGNAYVNEAKRQVYGAVGIDSLAGPSEVVILADESARLDFVIRDLFAQAEHDPDERAVLVTTSGSLATKVQKQCGDYLADSPRRDIVEIYPG